MDDKRHMPEFHPKIWSERQSEREWHHCKYCHRDVPTFLLTEGLVGNEEAGQTLRCCWECGSGLEQLEPRRLEG